MMEEMNAFERQIARVVHQSTMPPRSVDAMPIMRAATAVQPPKWRFQSMFRATKFFVAGVVVALFGGFLLAGMLTQPSEEAPGFTITSPALVARRLNALYPMESPARLYFTLLYGVLDTATGAFRFVSAGNPGPILAHADGQVEIFDVPGVPIGLLPDSTYEDTVIQMRAGDRLCLHSDGLSEERNQDGEFLGGERMRDLISRNRTRKLEDSLDALIAEAIRWRGSGQLHDDVAIVAAELVGD